MGIKLPNFNELSKDQQIPILNLPTDKNYVVLGPPGSGKTVLALHRAARLKKQGRDVLMLTYNRLLSNYLQDALKAIGLDNYTAQTYHSWLRWFFEKKLRKSLPTVPGNTYQHDWEKINNWTQDLPPAIDHLIIDETQDFPVELLRFLARISKTATVFADPHQAIFESTGASDLTSIFGTPNPYMLTRNYRNTREIEQASRCFANESELTFEKGAFREGAKPMITKIRSYNEANQAIMNYAGDNPMETIGVIVSANAVNATVKGLQNSGDISVEYYKAMSNTEIDITAPGIKVLSFGVMKGLEFDTVIIPDMDRTFRSSEDGEKDLRKLYVALSRASDRLLLYHQGRNATLAYPDAMGVLRNNSSLFDWGVPS